MKQLKKFFAGILVLAILMTMGLTVLADDGEVVGGVEGNPAKALLTKELHKALGVTTPTASFTFTFTPKKVDNVAYNATVGEVGYMPSIGSETISFGASDIIDTNAATTDVIELQKESSADVLAGITWPHGGEYIYEIEETPNTYTLDPTKERMTYSKQKFQMSVRVKNGTSNNTFVSEIIFREMIYDDDTDTYTVDEKANPIFVNEYEIMSTLKVSKTTTGEYADLTKKFPYNLTLVKSPLDKTTTTSYTAKIYNINDPLTAIDTITVPLGASTFSLANGEYIIIEKLPTGTTYTLEEPAAQYYTAKAVVTINSETPVSAENTTTNTALEIGSASGVWVDEVLNAPINIGENNNIADFTNNREVINPTGIILNNLPFILMVLLAIGGFIFFIIGKRRRKEEQ
jgi:hypothetical protein